jgi:3-phosphoshikimate 1-carboxyvinyltransferase
MKNVCLNKTRVGFFNLLKKQGAKIKFVNLKKEKNEIKGDILVKSSNLKPINASKKYYVNSTDEYPILFVIAALTEGVSKFYGIRDLANKESNRIKEMQNILKQIGVKSKSTKNNLIIFGKDKNILKNKKILVTTPKKK